MDNFNLIVSTGRNFEQQAKSELWFNLLSIGDDSPIIFKSEISGIILAYTKLEPRNLIYYLQDVMTHKDINYTQFIHKIYPLDQVVETDLEKIKLTTLDLIAHHPYCKPGTSFRITIRKRKTELNTNEIINAIADNLDFTVNLQEFDWNIQIEIIGNYTGIAILKKKDVFRPIRKRKTLKKNLQIEESI